MNVLEKHGEYWIVWHIYEEDSDLVKRFGFPGAISLPYFVAGQAKQVLEEKKTITLDEDSLLIGLLLKRNSAPPLTSTHKIRPYFDIILKDLLEDLLSSV